MTVFAHYQMKLSNSKVCETMKLQNRSSLLKCVSGFMALLRSSMSNSNKRNKDELFLLLAFQVSLSPSLWVCVYVCVVVHLCVGRRAKFCCSPSEQTNLEWVTLRRMFGQQMLEQRLPSTQWDTEILVTDFHPFTQSGAEQKLTSSPECMRACVCLCVWCTRTTFFQILYPHLQK